MPPDEPLELPEEEPPVLELPDEEEEPLVLELPEEEPLVLELPDDELDDDELEVGAAPTAISAVVGVPNSAAPDTDVRAM
jgi:hypothetical protein